MSYEDAKAFAEALGPTRRFKPWNHPEWERWRDREKHPTEDFAPNEFCKTCGFVHRRGNHAPAANSE